MPTSPPTCQPPTAIDTMNNDVYVSFKQSLFGKDKTTGSDQRKGKDKLKHVGQCIEPSFARVLGHNHFFAVYIANDISKNQQLVMNPNPLVLGNHFKKTAILPCGKFCQIHATGHLYAGDLLIDLSADRLNEIRKAHGQSRVPFRLMSQSGFFGGSDDSQLSSESTDYQSKVDGKMAMSFPTTSHMNQG